MSSTTQSLGASEQDRTLSDLLEALRHQQADPATDPGRKRRASERMKPVWAKLAKLQDPDGFSNHLAEFVQQEHHRRHNSDADPNTTRRGKPLCRCSRSRHVCEVKQGEIPSKIRTLDLKFIHKPDAATLAREYVQEHSGDVVIREAVEDYRDLRADIYAELSDILAMLMGREDPQPTEDEQADMDVSPSEEHVQSPSDETDTAHAPTAAADGGDDEPPEDADDAPALLDLPGVGVETDLTPRPEDGE